MQWIGFKRVAFVPVLRSETSPPDVAPANWEAEILRRLVCQTGTAGVDKSLRSWVFTVSSGIADLDPVVLSPVTVTTLSLPDLDADLGTRLRDDGVVHAVIVFPGRDRLPVDGFWSGIGMGDTDGAWAKCVVRGVTGYADISHQDDSVGGQFDMRDIEEELLDLRPHVILVEGRGRLIQELLEDRGQRVGHAATVTAVRPLPNAT